MSEVTVCFLLMCIITSLYVHAWKTTADSVLKKYADDITVFLTDDVMVTEILMEGWGSTFVSSPLCISTFHPYLE